MYSATHETTATNVHDHDTHTYTHSNTHRQSRQDEIPRARARRRRATSDARDQGGARPERSAQSRQEAAVVGVGKVMKIFWFVVVVGTEQ